MREYDTLRRPNGRQSSTPEVPSVFFTPYETPACTSLKDRDETDRLRAAQTVSGRSVYKQSLRFDDRGKSQLNRESTSGSEPSTTLSNPGRRQSSRAAVSTSPVRLFDDRISFQVESLLTLRPIGSRSIRGAACHIASLCAAFPPTVSPSRRVRESGDVTPFS
jgi:hypothetical protein